MADDVICLSSDDDFQEKKPKKKPTEVKKPVVVKKDDKQKKRKAPTELDTSKPKKRIQPTQIDKPGTSSSASNDGVEVMEVVATEESSNHTTSHNKSTSDDSSRPSTSKAGSDIETTGNGPKLEIREKRPVDNTQDGSEVFAQFLGQCLMKDRSSDMKKVVDRLKRHYEQTDPAYKHSPAFITLLNEKRSSLMNDGKVYVHIGDIDKEMKCRRRGTVPKEEENREEEGEAVIDEATAELRQKNESKIRLVEKAMEKCRKKIEKLENSEVDWDDDENSNYIQLTRYEEKMAQLFYKLCELTGDDADAGRRYLRPKYLKVTKIEDVDQAIISFVNQKLQDRRKKTQKGKSTADCFLFPDFQDILKCIEKCNENKKLGMNEKSMKKLAERAFKDLGNYLQRLRREDLLDGLSMLPDDAVDPAEQDPELLRRLEESKIRGRQRLDGVFEEYAKKQEEGSGKGNDSDSDGGEDAEDDEEEAEEEEEEENGSKDDDTDNEIDSVSLEEPEETVVPEKREESPIDSFETEEDALKDNEVTPMEVSDMSDSETATNSPPKNIKEPQVILSNKLFVQPYKIVSDVGGTVTVDAKYSAPETSSKSSKPGPKSSKITQKPSITNIENVRVVIKAHEIVRKDDKTETRTVPNDSTSDPVPTTSELENELEHVNSLPERIGASENVEKVQTAKSFPTENNENTLSVANTSKALDEGGGVECNPKILQEEQKTQPIAEENSLSKEGSVENQEITSSTEDNIGKTESSEIMVLEDTNDLKKTSAITESDSPSPDSTLKVPDVEETETSKVKTESENDVRPVLKLRSFAKTPDFWTNSPDKRTQMMASKKQMVTPETIEVVDLEDSPVKTNNPPARINPTVGKSSNIPGPASSVSQLVLMPVDSRGRQLTRTAGTQPTVIRILEPGKQTKARVIGSPSRTKILPMTSAPSSSQTVHLAQSVVRPIQNMTVGSSSIPQKTNTSVRINPVNRQALATHSPDRLVNPVSMLKIIHKRQ